ncbi:MAG TPA: hypothetical protein DCO79_10110, partial [Spirochaeta sp.]|nr:hypothetical protein [Spirochaeta sp.]
MMKKQRTYSKELKQEAVKMVLEQGLTHKEVGRRLSIPSGTIGGWMTAAKAGRIPANPGDLSVAELTAQNAKLRKQLAEARMEKEILKKAAAYFAKESLPGTHVLSQLK